DGEGGLELELEPREHAGLESGARWERTGVRAPGDGAHRAGRELDAEQAALVGHADARGRARALRARLVHELDRRAGLGAAVTRHADLERSELRGLVGRRARAVELAPGVLGPPGRFLRGLDARGGIRVR